MGRQGGSRKPARSGKTGGAVPLPELGEPRSVRARTPEPVEDEFSDLERYLDAGYEEDGEEDEDQLVETIPYTLPSGHTVACLSEEEVRLCDDTARPYLCVANTIPQESWLHIKNYLDLVLLRERTLAQTRRKRFLKLDVNAQKDIRSSVVTLSREINEFAKRLDPLKTARGEDGETPVEWRREVERKALEYGMTHRGEYTWLANCPEPTCRYHKQPFMMLMEVAHFAMDPCAGPGVVWNDEVMELVHLHYCRSAECKHIAHRKHYRGSLSVRDAALILRVSPIGILATAKLDRQYDLGIEYDLDVPETLRPFMR